MTATNSLPQIIAHRGYSAKYPEQTPIAFEEALKLPIYGIECDVQRTGDGHLVVIHDDTVDRCSDGRGAVADMTLEQLRRLNFGTPEQPQQIFTLEELLDLLARYPGKHLFLETKHPSRWEELVEEQSAAILRNRGMAADGRVSLISFSRPAIERCAQLLPELDRYLLISPRLKRGDLASADCAAATGVGPEIDWARQHPDIVGLGGRKTYVWTVDAPADLLWCRDHGVSFVGTNDPALALRTIQEAI